jgi:hypothetical protein
MKTGISVAARVVLGASMTLVAFLLLVQRPHAQSYSSGQNVWPAFEGWEKNADGSQSFLFGYMNDNWEEELDVPIGPDNSVEPGGPDLKQPTHFLPRRNRFMFRVRVPKDFGEKEMIWTLTTRGKTAKAYATLRTDSQIDNVDLMSETGALGAGLSNPEIRADKPPVVKIEGAATRSAKVGQPLTLSAIVTDDGIPRTRSVAFAGQQEGRSGGPGVAGREGGDGTSGGRGNAGAPGPGRNPAFFPPVRVTVGKTLGLHLSWFVYRGAGTVTFDPSQVKSWEDTRAGANSPWAPIWNPPPVPADGRYVVQATFSEAGTYVLRARADDGALFTDQDLTVSVSR